MNLSAGAYLFETFCEPRARVNKPHSLGPTGPGAPLGTGSFYEYYVMVVAAEGQDGHRCFYEKAHFVKGQRGGLREATRSQPKPLRAPFLFALRLSQSKVARCSMGSVRGKALPFEPRPPMQKWWPYTQLFAVALGL